MEFRLLTSVPIVAATIVAFLASSCVMDRNQELAETVNRILEPYADTTSVAVVAMDPASGWRFEHNPDRIFHAASTMKVPVLIELFKEAAAGELSLGDSLTVKTEFRSIADSSIYTIDSSTDSDQEIYEWVGSQVGIIDLAHRMIYVSSNLATNLLIELVGPENVQRTIEQLGTTNMQVLRGVEDLKAYRSGMNNTATAADLATLLGALAEGKAVSPEADRKMLAILEEQHFSEMIPSGLPEGTRVAHKTGQIAEIHHDAAVILPESHNAYVLVILTEGFPDDSISGRIGAEIAAAVHKSVTTRSTD